MVAVVATIQVSAWLALVGVFVMGVALRWTVTAVPGRAARVWRWWKSGIPGS
jgi:hypothetical protein